jgi:hypothetical protein
MPACLDRRLVIIPVRWVLIPLTVVKFSVDFPRRRSTSGVVDLNSLFCCYPNWPRSDLHKTDFVDLLRTKYVLITSNTAFLNDPSRSLKFVMDLYS